MKCLTLQPAHPVVICAVHISGHAEVSDLHEQVLPHQAVACGQISVNEMLRSQIHHAGCDLLSNVQHLRLSQLHQQTLLPVCH